MMYVPTNVPCQNALMPSRMRLLRMTSMRGGADDGAEGGSGAARQVRAADHRRRDDGQLHALTEARGDRAEPAHPENAGTQ